MKELRVLVPLVSRKENNEEFLQRATENAKEVFLLLVIDQKEMVGQFGFAASEIMQGTTLLEQIKALLEAKKIHAKDIVEWGNAETKIEHVALLQKVDKIFFLEQNNEYFRSLSKRLNKKLEGKIEIVKISQEKEIKEENLGIGKT